MFVQGQIIINSTKEDVWRVVSDFENASNVFKDIKSVEILANPNQGLLGLKWKEVRVFMGKEAAEIMWIIEATENKSYTSEAKNSGCLYHSSIILEDCEEGVVVLKTFKSTPQSFIAKLMAPIMFLMKGMLKKCLLRDLEDLRSHLGRA